MLLGGTTIHCTQIGQPENLDKYVLQMILKCHPDVWVEHIILLKDI